MDMAANGYDSIIPTMLSGLPDLLMAVVVILVLSASMSTLSSLVLTSSSTLTLDLLKDHFWKDMDQKSQVFVMRCLIVVFIAISVVLAIIQYRSNVTFIAQLMGVSWGALAGAFLAPFLYGLYWKKATKAACWASFLFSTVVMLANIFLQSSFPALLQLPHQRRGLLHAGRAGHRSGGLAVHPQPDAALVEDAFSCYDRKVLVRQREAPGDGEKTENPQTPESPQETSFSKAETVWYAIHTTRFRYFGPIDSNERNGLIPMVIDIHTHTFPDRLAATTIPKLEQASQPAPSLTAPTPDLPPLWPGPE